MSTPMVKPFTTLAFFVKCQVSLGARMDFAFRHLVEMETEKSTPPGCLGDLMTSSHSTRCRVSPILIGLLLIDLTQKLLPQLFGVRWSVWWFALTKIALKKILIKTTWNSKKQVNMGWIHINLKNYWWNWLLQILMIESNLTKKLVEKNTKHPT